MLARRPPFRPAYRANIHSHTRPVDIIWKSEWSFIISNIIAILMIICVVIIAILEIVFLAIAPTSGYIDLSIAPGLWCGVFPIIASVIILMLKWMRSMRQWATIALITTIIAFCFTVVLIGLVAKTINDWLNYYIFNFDRVFYKINDRFQIRAAQLAFACVELILCIAFIILYTIVFVRISNNRSQQQPR